MGVKSSGPMWRRYVRFLGADPGADVDEELRFHLEERVDELVSRGMSPGAARAEAERRLGDMGALRRELEALNRRVERGRHRRESLAALIRDARFSLRQLRKEPVFALVSLATLALGIGASVAMFTVVNGVLLRPLPYPEPDRLVELLPGQNANMALADVVGASPSLEASTGLALWGLTLTGVGDAARITAQMVDAPFFEVFGVSPALGRPFRPKERDPDISDVVILSHGLWRDRFGADPSILGRRLELDGGGHTSREVVGVMPAGFEAPMSQSARVDAWIPLSRAPRTFANDSTWYVNSIVARMRPGTTPGAVAGEVGAAVAGLRAEYGSLISEETVRTAGAMSLLESIVGEVRATLWTLLAAVGLVLLLACANLANLLLARGERRRQELAVRGALGAGRGRLIREQLVDGVVLAVLGGGVGVLLARALLGALGVAEGSGLPRASSLELDLRVLGFALAVSLGSVLIFGLVPALRAAAEDPARGLRSGARSLGASAPARRTGFALIAVEVALAMILVTGAGLLLTSMQALRSVDPGLETDNVLAIELAPPAEYAGARVVSYYEQVVERTVALPGVRRAGAVHLLPFTDANWAFPYLAQGHPPPSDGPLPSANFRVVTPGYFATVGIPMLAGRDVASADRAGAHGVGLINRAMAESLWPGEDPIGREIRVFGNVPFEVVGVVGDVRQHALDRPPAPEMYVPHAQWPRVTFMTVMLETTGDPALLAGAARRAIAELDPAVPVVNARPLAEILGDSIADRRFFAGVLLFFGFLALVLGAVGVYGVMAGATASRLREYGIRMALGASSAAVLRRSLAAGLTPLVAGLAIGTVGALFGSRLLAGLLYGVDAGDVRTLTASAAVLGLIATAAVTIPAYRATRVDPATVLRAE
jgi:putative ABC transport system permease protein